MALVAFVAPLLMGLAVFVVHPLMGLVVFVNLSRRICHYAYF
jgi:hypothetical protein